MEFGLQQPNSYHKGGPIFTGHDSVRDRVEEIIAKIKGSDRQNVFSRMAEDRATDLARHNGIPQELIDKAEATSDPKQKDRYYLEAAVLLILRDKDYEQALPLIQKVSNEVRSHESGVLIIAMGASMALMKGDAEKAYSYAECVGESGKRAHILTAIANDFVTKKKYERARVLLEEAGELLSKSSDSEDKLRMLIWLADVSVLIDPNLGFAAMQTAVEADNRIEFDSDRQGHDISNGMIVVTGMSRFDRNQSFSWLARKDFDRALSLAKQIQDSEASVVAQLAVCRGILKRSISPQPMDMFRIR